MAAKQISGRVQSRIDTATNWSAKNPILLEGEIGIESDTCRLKAGNGVAAWNTLPYLRGPSDISVSVNSQGDTWIEVPVENLIVGNTEPTNTNAIWMEVKE